ncbi:MAG: acetylxylan esterase [Tenericutes bacterium]|nr:acetylxylan esterase [Mycoplasmatota bacterium]
MSEKVVRWIEPKDFNDFWNNQISNIESVNPNFQVIKTEDFTQDGTCVYFKFTGAQHETLYGFYLKHNKQEKTPAVLHFHGYWWHKGEPSDYLDWFLEGYAVIVMDIRGQKGESKDTYPYKSGFKTEDHRLMVRGIEDPNESYLLHVCLDGYQLVKIAKSLPFVNKNEIILDGYSQGGGMVVTLGGLTKVSLICADVPGNTHFYYRYHNQSGSGMEFYNYVKENNANAEKILSNLKYFDNIFHAKRIQSPILISVGLVDKICPASYFKYAYKNIKSDKHLVEYEGAGHEGGEERHQKIKLTWVREKLNENRQLAKTTNN